MRNRETPRILYVSPHWPHRATTASELRALGIARALQQFGKVEVVVVDGEAREQEWAATPSREFNVAYSVPVEVHPNNGVGEKVSWALNPRKYYPHGCGVSDEALRRVLRSAQEFDLIWFCKLRTPNMFPRWAWARSVTDIDDVPSTYEREAWRLEPGARARLVGLMRFVSWKRRDRLLGERFTVLGVCSDADKRYLQTLGVKTPAHVIPNGSERPAATLVRRLATPPRIGFVGIFDYWPNLSGIQWFAKECWPRIKREIPGARLRLVGRYSDGPSKVEGSDIDGLGWVGEVAEEIATWSAMVVPIHVGAGTRGKIVQAFSLKCPVISTTLGAYGYEAQDGQIMSLSDSAEGFAEACVRAIRQPAAAAAMAERAWQQFLEKWTWEAIQPRVWSAAEDCLQRSGTAACNEGV